MTAHDLTALIHLVGFVTGIALYGMLAMMTRRAAAFDRGRGGITLLAAVLGLVWNAGALFVFGWQDFALGQPSPWIMAIAYSALGFLPAVVVDSATRRGTATRPSPLAIAAYGLSAVATAIQIVAVADHGTISTAALLTLTIGYVSIVAFVAASSGRRTDSKRTVTGVALSVFAVSALHLSHHSSASDSWVVELIGHHASLPLVFVLLYQDYRFALADIFLKRAAAGIALVALILASYALLLGPLQGATSRVSAGMPVALLALWVATALVYPLIRLRVDRFVDRVVLGRADYREARLTLTRRLSVATTPDVSVAQACDLAQLALGAAHASWSVESDRYGIGGSSSLVTEVDDGTAATVHIPTADQPSYRLSLRLAAGRRLLSDDVAFLDAAALLIARRVDEQRVAEERLERELREEEMRRLAAESELQALRAQLNPHFLFNALSTLGHLIRTAPPKALDTLYQLTALLRAVLGPGSRQFVTLREEMQIVDAYLAIESARFEERLTVIREVPLDLIEAAIPPLILQPLVENAIKHGISPLRDGGVVHISARISTGPAPRLRLIVADTGAGSSATALSQGRRAGIGLANIERRLHHYFGDEASLNIATRAGEGTSVELSLPLTLKPAYPIHSLHRAAS